MAFKYGKILIPLLLAAHTFACSDDGDGDGNGNGDGTGGDLPDIDIGIGGGAGGTGSGSTLDGGSINLTPEQVDDIENAACTGWTGEGEALPAVLQVVLDASTSMSEGAPGNPGQNKWDVTEAALREAFDQLSASTSLGLLIYPNMSTGGPRIDEPRDITECVDVDEMIDIDLLGAPGSAHRETIDDELQSNGPGQSAATPTHDAYQYALENSLIPYTASVQKFMLLITDGVPTFAQGCMTEGPFDAQNGVNPQPIVDDIEDAFQNERIRTFLIGSPGSEPGRDWMSRAAVVGGTARVGCDEDGPDYCHMDMTQASDFSAALRTALGQVVGQVSPCEYNLPDPPTGETLDLNQVNLILHRSSGQASLVLQDTVGECTEGWQLNDQNQVILCEQTCNEADRDPDVRVQLMFGCAADQIIPR